MRSGTLMIIFALQQCCCLPDLSVCVNFLLKIFLRPSCATDVVLCACD
jgi:hypothetical protein